MPITARKANQSGTDENHGKAIATHAVSNKPSINANRALRSRTKRPASGAANITQRKNTVELAPISTSDAPCRLINVATSGVYDIDVRASTTFSNSAYHIKIDGRNVTGTITVPSTGSWSTFKWAGTKRVSLTAGNHVMKVFADREYFNLNAIRVRTPQ